MWNRRPRGLVSSLASFFLWLSLSLSQGISLSHGIRANLEGRSRVCPTLRRPALHRLTLRRRPAALPCETALQRPAEVQRRRNRSATALQRQNRPATSSDARIRLPAATSRSVASLQHLAMLPCETVSLIHRPVFRSADAALPSALQKICLPLYLEKICLLYLQKICLPPSLLSSALQTPLSSDATDLPPTTTPTPCRPVVAEGPGLLPADADADVLPTALPTLTPCRRRRLRRPALLLCPCLAGPV